MPPFLALLLKITVSLLPVLIFLLALVFLDSYKLVKISTLAAAVAGGMAAAAVSYAANSALLPAVGDNFVLYSRYGSPLIEEILKAAVVLVFFFRRHKIGFLVDAAILGFSVGAGFSLLENIFYLRALSGSDIAVWAVRGIGTAMMHGGTTAVFSVLTKARLERRSRPRKSDVFPGLALAVLLHSGFNHFLLPPLVSTAILLVAWPLVAVNVFILSERHTRKWLDLGFDSDMELLELIGAGRFSATKIGTYLLSLKDRFSGEVLADLFCLIRLRTELSVGAKGILLMKEAGFSVKPDPAIREKFEEMAYLEKSVGPTGLLAIAPILHRSRRDLWELNMLGGPRGTTGSKPA